MIKIRLKYLKVYGNQDFFPTDLSTPVPILPNVYVCTLMKMLTFFWQVSIQKVTGSAMTQHMFQRVFKHYQNIVGLQIKIKKKAEFDTYEFVYVNRVK